MQEAKKELEKLISNDSKQVGFFTHLDLCVKMFVRQCVQTVAADVAVLAEVTEGVSRVVTETGCEVDVLVNSAGITHTAAMLDTPSEKYQVGRGVGSNLTSSPLSLSPSL